ncbi:hypothetical protein JTB14_034955 [Gonioctena quinquepunctata]|nr:hypothetical protein JTB14_034955 [Gonioctena quinquepunctata]
MESKLEEMVMCQFQEDWDPRVSRLSIRMESSSIMVSNDNEYWERGVVLKVDEKRRKSYQIKLCKSNRVKLRNRKFLRKIDIHQSCKHDIYNFDQIPESSLEGRVSMENKEVRRMSETN